MDTVTTQVERQVSRKERLSQAAERIVCEALGIDAITSDYLGKSEASTVICEKTAVRWFAAEMAECRAEFCRSCGSPVWLTEECLICSAMEWIQGQERGVYMLPIEETDLQASRVAQITALYAVREQACNSANLIRAAHAQGALLKDTPATIDGGF